MAWDALGGMFKQKKDREGTQALFGSRPAGGWRWSGAQTPQAMPNGGFGGTAGSNANSGSARFVNYGTLYGANEEKAKSMAGNVYRGAEKTAEDAKSALEKAKEGFGQQVQQGTGKGPEADRFGHQNKVTGGWNVGAPPAAPKPHGTGTAGSGVKVSANAGPLSTAGTKPANTLYTGGTGTVVVDNSNNPPDAYTAKDYALYGQLMGDGNVLDGGARAGAVGDPFDTLGAMSGAGQQYTGPDSLKDYLGDEGYGKLAQELQKGQEAVGGLQDSGGIAQALGYAGNSTGNAAMDAGLTQTAGQAAFKKLKDRYAGLGQMLPDAQADSIKTADAAGIQTEVAAAEWQKMLDDYEAANAPKPEQEKPRDPWDTERDMSAWAQFVGATDATIGGLNSTSGAYQTLSDAGYTNDQIFKAFVEWRKRNGGKEPTADDLLLILTEGGY